VASLNPASPSFLDALVAIAGARARAGVPLAPLTTFNVGGAADFYVETRSGSEVRAVVRLAAEWHLPLTVLGGGSNVLVSDRGVRGVVIRPRAGTISQTNAASVSADAAVTINGLVRWTIGRGLAGVEAWAGTPGTVGGGICGNAHFQGRLLSEHVIAVTLVDRQGRELEADPSSMGFGYDRSRLQTSGEILLSALFRVGPGTTATLRETARASLAYRKRTQPLNMPSAGCIFQNPGADDPLPEGIPRSAGALIDRAGLKGVRAGGARVSPLHANFIVNDNHATAADVRSLIDRCRDQVAAAFGVTLREEIVYLGEF
jgi:UDP-N-acetylmuramate dehydrogenase